MLSWLKKLRSDNQRNGPDWSFVDSREKAEALVTEGELAKLQLLPEAFGGDQGQHNLVYVPPFVLDIKYGIDSYTIMPLVQEGKVKRYVASPRYEGKSLVPGAIEINATEPANFNALVKIWGKALAE
jgi:hypothetical protein